MATRLYFGTTDAVGALASVTQDGTNWVGSLTGFTNKMFTTTAASSFVTAAPSTSFVNQSWAIMQWWSPPMASTHLWSTVTTNSSIRVAEANLSNNMFCQWGLRLMDITGTTTNSIAFFRQSVEHATTLTSRRINGSTNLFDPAFTNAVGDRICITLGVNRDVSSTGTGNASMEYGGNAGTDLDLTTTDVNQDNPWFEVSHNITWGAEPTPSTLPNFMMMMGTGT